MLPENFSVAPSRQLHLLQQQFLLQSLLVDEQRHSPHYGDTLQENHPLFSKLIFEMPLIWSQEENDLDQAYRALPTHRESNTSDKETHPIPCNNQLQHQRLGL